jgi:hypothetical protein
MEDEHASSISFRPHRARALYPVVSKSWLAWISHRRPGSMSEILSMACCVTWHQMAVHSKSERLREKCSRKSPREERNYLGDLGVRGG